MSQQLGLFSHEMTIFYITIISNNAEWRIREGANAGTNSSQILEMIEVFLVYAGNDIDLTSQTIHRRRSRSDSICLFTTVWGTP